MPSFGVITRRRLPLVSLPKLTVPEISARIAGSFGLRASNKSATRGRPPVMSRVFEPSCGIRAITSPHPICAPSPDYQGVGGRKYCARYVGTGSSSSLPFHQPASLQDECPCRSGTICRIDDSNVGQTSQFIRLTLDGDALFHAHEGHGTATSVMIGWVCGSQLATMAPASTLSSLPSRKSQHRMAACSARAHDPTRQQSPAHRNGYRNQVTVSAQRLQVVQTNAPPFFT